MMSLPHAPGSGGGGVATRDGSNHLHDRSQVIAAPTSDHGHGKLRTARFQSDKVPALELWHCFTMSIRIGPTVT